jgi:hypothetical protein
MRRWPPALWLFVYVASELILLGSHGRWALLVAGGALALLAFLSALRLALRRHDRHPRAQWFYWAVGGVALCYVPSAIAASALGVEWAAGALAAAIIPMTAVSLLLAVVRQHTDVTENGLRDIAGDRDDPTPGIGMDDVTPLGDTSEHSDAIDEPKRSSSDDSRRADPVRGASLGERGQEAARHGSTR